MDGLKIMSFECVELKKLIRLKRTALRYYDSTTTLLVMQWRNRGVEGRRINVYLKMDSV